jgi:hypothetical protein
MKSPGGWARTTVAYADSARLEDELKRLCGNYVQAGLWRGFVVRDGVTGRQNFSGAETARMWWRPSGDELRLRVSAMRVIAFDRFKPGVTLETIQPFLAEEVANVWRLWKSGVVRENYARADQPGVVIVFEVEDVAAAQALVAEFPMTKAGYLEWFYVALMAPVMLESQFSGAALEASGPAGARA